MAFVVAFLSILACDDAPGNVSINNDLQVYPNPFGDQAHVRVVFNESGSGSIKVFDPSGETVLDETFSVPGDYDFTINGAGMPSGKYYAVCRTSAGEITRYFYKKK